MSVKNLCRLSRDEVKALFNSIDTILTDCDGVLWLHTKALPGSPEVLNRFHEMGKRVFYITNNNVITREEFLIKCDKLGYKSSKDSVLTTSYLTACYLQDIGFRKKVYVVGSSGISRELNFLGIRNFGVGPDHLVNDVGTLVMNCKLDPDVGAVVVGFDEHISYPKILKAVSYLNHPHCLFIATNTDETGPNRIGDCVVPVHSLCISSSDWNLCLECLLQRSKDAKITRGRDLHHAEVVPITSPEICVLTFHK